MKTALCLSGHLRTFRNTFESLRQNIIEPLNCDVFIHTWDVIGANTGKTHADNIHQGIKTVDFLDEIENAYHPKFMSIEDQNDKINELKERCKDIRVPKNEQSFIVQHVALHVSMFYSIWAANNLKKEYQQESGEKYDLVIRCRPDLFMKSRLEPGMFLEQRKIYLPEIGTYCHEGVNDQMAIGSESVMDKYSDIYLQIIDYYRTHRTTARPEALIKYHLQKKLIPIEMRQINYDMYRLDGTIYRQYKMHGETIPGYFLG